MKFDKDKNGWEFIAYASRMVWDDGERLPCGIEFEAIEADRLTPFLNRDRNFLSQPGEETMKKALHAYLEYGEDSHRFFEAKLPHTGNYKNCYEITVWMDSTLADQIECGSWWKIVQGEGYYCKGFAITNPDEVVETTCDFFPMTDAESAALKKIFKVQSIRGKNQIHKETDEEVNEGISAINRNTKFFRALVYYMGAALCVGLRSAVYHRGLGIYYPGPVVGYFDFGYSSGTGSAHLAVRNRAPIVAANLATIQGNLVANPNQHIIISHWHSDHTRIVDTLFGNAAYDPFWGGSRWYTPDTASPRANNVLNDVRANGGTIDFFTTNNPANNNLYKIAGNWDLQYGKVDAFYTSNHPHHHGVYARLRLVDMLGRVSKTLLLPGDCTYSGIPAARKNNADYLQACHHGGDYALAPSVQIGRTAHIPTPNPPPNPPGTVIYSADGHYHGHPNAVFMGEYTAAGWTVSERTDAQATAGANFVVVDG